MSSTNMCGKNVPWLGLAIQIFMVGLFHPPNMISWMKKTFGTPAGSNHITKGQAGLKSANVHSLLQAKKGIYGMTPMNTSKRTGFGAFGHIDMIINQA